MIQSLVFYLFFLFLLLNHVLGVTYFSNTKNVHVMMMVQKIYFSR